MAKFTRWFPATTTPVRPGVYQRRLAGGAVIFSKWSGAWWKLVHPTAEGAARMRSVSRYQGGEWRGLAADPAGVAIPATWQHDAGAYAQCHFCLRYTRNPKALSHRSFLCDCGSAEGWSGSFKPPGPDARWLAADGVPNRCTCRDGKGLAECPLHDVFTQSEVTRGVPADVPVLRRNWSGGLTAGPADGGITSSDVPGGTGLALPHEPQQEKRDA